MMKTIYTRSFTLLVMLALAAGKLLAQGVEGYGSGIKVPLDSAGQKYIRIANWHQFWIRNSENNPGSMVNGEASSGQTDFAIRRSRFLFYTQINPKFMVLTHFGINNQTLIGGGALGQAANTGVTSPDGKKPQIFIHEATVEHKIYKDYLTIGGGLHYWNGISRLGSASTGNFMTLDAPIFNWPNIDASDQFARQMGVFFKGKYKKFDYRFAINQPFALSTANALTKFDTTAAKNDVVNASYRGIGAAKHAYQGYVMYQFRDQEANLLPYMAGSYLGTKNVLNVGAGFYTNPEAMWAAQKNSSSWDTLRQNCLIWAADVFYDHPLNKTKGTAITMYAMYNYLNLGTNFLRNIGISNPANGVAKTGATFSGTGNSYPTVGTGSIIYCEAGYLFKKLKKLGKFQIMGDVTYAKYDRIEKALVIPNVGINWFLNGHSAKVTFNYKQRPVVDYSDATKTYGSLKQVDSKGEFVIQLQIFL